MNYKSTQTTSGHEQLSSTHFFIWNGHLYLYNSTPLFLRSYSIITNVRLSVRPLRLGLNAIFSAPNWDRASLLMDVFILVFLINGLYFVYVNVFLVSLFKLNFILDLNKWDWCANALKFQKKSIVKNNPRFIKKNVSKPYFCTKHVGLGGCQGYSVRTMLKLIIIWPGRFDNITCSLRIFMQGTSP